MSMIDPNLKLARCGFCKPSCFNGIFVNAIEFINWCHRNEGDGPKNLADVADQQILNFSYVSPKLRPCEHMVQLAIDLSCGVMKNDTWQPHVSTSFAWRMPVAEEAGPIATAIDFIWTNVTLYEGEALFWPDSPRQIHEIWREWLNPGQDTYRDGDLIYRAEGFAVLAGDIPAFIDEFTVVDHTDSEVS